MRLAHRDAGQGAVRFEGAQEQTAMLGQERSTTGTRRAVAGWTTNWYTINGITRTI